MPGEIPKHIGSKLGQFNGHASNTESFHRLNVTEVNPDAKHNGLKKLNDMEKGRKLRKTAPGKQVKRKRAGGEKKMPPVNPAAIQVEEKAEELLPPKELAKDKPDLIKEASDEQSLVQSLKSLPKKKKSVTKAAPRKRTSRKTVEVQQPANLAPKEVSKETEVKEVAAIEPKKTILTKDTSSSQEKLLPPPAEKPVGSEAIERRLYVRKIKEEVRLFLEQLATERKERKRQ